MATRFSSKLGNGIVPGKEAQKRYRRRKKLKLEAAELTRNVQERIGYRDPGLARKLLFKIGIALDLPFRWDDNDMQKAENYLRTVRKELFDKHRKEKLTGLRDSLYHVYQETEGETSEKLNEVREFYTDIINELSIVDPEKLEDNETNFILLMTLGGKIDKMPDWFSDRLTDYIFNHFHPNQIESCGLKFSEKYSSYLEEQEKYMMLLGAVKEQEPEDEIVIGVETK